MRRLYAALLLACLLLVATPTVSYAAGDNPFDGDTGRTQQSSHDTSGLNCNDGAQSQSAFCQSVNKDGVNPISGKDGILIKIANIIAYVAGAAAIIVLIISGIKYITSSGDSNATASARKTAIYAGVGILVIVFARVLINVAIRAT